MIIGIGTDIVEISRIAKAIESEAFARKCFTEDELQNARPESLAANFAAKEAVAKALGTGFRGFSPIDIEILRDELGKPRAVLYNGAKAAADGLSVTALHISLTHSKEYAVAFAVAEAE